MRRSKDKRSLYIDSTDAKSREVSASYIIPAPVWKSSYRLLLEGTEPTLEGWAIVDNTTGEDWTNVRMSLISGKPISFISALYEPKYNQRLSADLAEDQAVAPTVFQGGIGGGSGGGFLPAAAPPAPHEPCDGPSHRTPYRSATGSMGVSKGRLCLSSPLLCSPPFNPGWCPAN